MHQLKTILQEYWGYTAFRPMQEQIIQSVLAGNDTLALLPTGGGKSICFQVPAMAKEGICLVVSPLIALMKDQVETLRKKGITAFALTSTNNRKETIHILQTASNSNCKFLYVSPERLQTTLFLEYLPALDISLIAVDEAHCISQWGYDFRPSYLQIASLREHLPDIPILAVTASATPEVQQDIQDKLLFQQPYVFKGSFLRPNLSFRVLNVESKIDRLKQILEKTEGSTIIYCRSRKATQDLSSLLQLHNYKVDFYHAGLSPDQRSSKQEAWIKNELRIIVCTNAFGMGIDKPDVRLVVHYDIPDCIENYYQEAGRAGRDGKKAYAVLLYRDKELADLQLLSEMRFPSVETISYVYQCIVHYLQIPVGSGSGIWFDFDLQDFTHRFKLSRASAIASLQLLEQEGWVTYAGQIYLPAKVEFTTNRRDMELFEEQHPQLEPLIKSLLRTYGGILDMPTAISELLLAKIMGIQKEEVQLQLRHLNQAGLIHYQPQKDTPQLQLLEDRPITNHFLIHPEQWQQRKKQFEKRIRMMKEYITNTGQCRSSIITRYFGDNQHEECGICDNCLSKKTNNHAPLQTKPQLEQLLRDNQHLPLKSILNQLEEKDRHTAIACIQFLQAEEKAGMDEEGRFIFRKNE